MKKNKLVEKRLAILTSSEKALLYEIPHFTLQERKFYFQLNKVEKELMDNHFLGVTSKLYFILQLGYFEASHRFFKFKLSDVIEDAEYIMRVYFQGYSLKNIHDVYNKKTRLNHCTNILQLFSYRHPSKKDKNDIFEKIKMTVLIDANPKYIFKELARYLFDKKIVLLPYSKMQDMISAGILEQESKLYDQIDTLIDEPLRIQLDNLLVKESKSKYQLTIIKSPAQNFTYSHAKNEREKSDELEPIFDKAKLILQEISISNLSIKYFAKIVDRYTIFQLKRFEKRKKYFYILCFVYYRYLKVNDALIKTFLFLVGKYKGEVKSAVKENIYQMRFESVKNLKKGAKILRIINNPNIIEDTQSAKELRDYIYTILPRNKMDTLARYRERTDINFEEFRWLEYDKRQSTISRNIRHIFKTLKLLTNSKKENAPLFHAAIFLQDYLKKIVGL